MYRLVLWFNILLLIWPGLAAGAYAAAPQPQAGDVRVENDLIRAEVAATGQFVVGTVGGDPGTAEDDGKNLMYGYGRDHFTSFSSVRLIDPDGTVRDVPLLQASGEPSETAGNSVTMRWDIGSVRVEQILSPAANPFTDRPDTFKITTIVTNDGDDALQAGIRVMLDTMIGANDNAPFFVPGTGNTDVEREYSGDQIPAYWKAFEASDYNPNSLKGKGILTGFGATPPDRFVIARWPAIRRTVWDYDITPGTHVGDSAAAIYWMPVSVEPGASNTWVTYYGLAGVGGGSAWIDAPLSVTSPEPGFQATLWVSNPSDADFRGGQAQLALPAGLQLAPGESARKPMPDVPANGGAQSVTWRLVAGGTVDADYPYSGTVTFGSGSPPLSASARVHYGFVASPVPTPTATPQPSATPLPLPIPPPPPPPRASLPWWLLPLPLFLLPLLLLMRRRSDDAARPPAPPPVRPRAGAPLVASRPSQRPGPGGSDVTHGRPKRTKPEE